jgi:hypothetical protein
MRVWTFGLSLGLVAATGLVGCGSDDTSSGSGGGASGGGAGVSGSGGTSSGGTTSGGGSGGATGGAAGGFATLPWEGGPAYYSKWKNGPSTDPKSFPIAVWLQSPSKASEYASIGVNLFIGLWQGPTDAQLTDLSSAGMPTFCAQEGVWSSHVADPTIRAWTHQDEPDNAQPDGNGGYGPCVDPKDIVSLYQTMVANDSSRPVYLNFGQGVAYTDWIGRGVCTGKTEMYPEYAKGADIVSFDIYPVNSTDTKVHGKLEYVAKGVDLLRQAVSYEKPVWVWIETTDFNGTGNAPTVDQIRSEVWMALVHGARGIGYFAHVFSPSFIEAGLLADATIKAGVGGINAEVQSLAEVLNEPSLDGVVKVSSSNSAVPVDIVVKQHAGSFYVFAVSMANGTTNATFELTPSVGASATVLGESRSVAVTGGSFSDSFDGYAVHLYQLN